MPALPVVPQVIKLKVEGTYHDAKWLNLWYVHYTGGPPSSGDLNTYLVHLAGNFITAYNAEMSADNECVNLVAEDLTSDTGASNAYPLSGAFGVRAGDFMPAGVAMVASMEINRRYRGGHPRKYLPWGTAGTMASGSTIDWDSSFVADCQLKLGTLLTELLTGPFGSTITDEVVNVSYVTGGARRATAQVDIVNSAIIRDRICSQRRRLGKVGG